MKKFIKTTSGKKGGLFVGKSHDKGGIPAIVVDTGQPIEVEGGEVIINKEASKKYWKELSKINQSAGNGVPIPPPMDFSADVEKYKGGGKITMSSLKQGTEIEMEHAKTIAEFKKQSVSLKEVARKIAKDHLKENPNYYKIISKLKLKNGGEIVCRSCGWSWLKSEGGNDLYICHKCNADNQKFYKKGGKTQSLSLPEKSKIYEQWKDLVNMSKAELQKFYNSVEGKKAGLSSEEAKSLGIDNGRTSARWIMKMKDVPFVNWTDEMWRWAKKQINFIKRMSGNRGALYNDKGVKTRKHTSLLIWGHNPEKFNLGGSVEFYERKYSDGKKQRLSIDEYDKLITYYDDNFQIRNIGGEDVYYNKKNELWNIISEKDYFKLGGRTISQTPAPKKERIFGSKKNPPKSSESSKSAEKIVLSEQVLESIETILRDHNKTSDKKVDLNTAKAVIRRGMGAYSSSHRPTISGGKANSRVAWGLARLKAFLYKIENGESKSGKYSQDNDLIDELGYEHEKFAKGNKIKAENKGGDCYIVAGKIALNKKLPIFAKEKEFPKFHGTPYVVHAEVSGQGSISGLRYGHAWVEDDLYVYDFSNGREIVFPKHIYYAIGNVVEKTPKYFKYTFKEAIEKMLETGHYGSWELKTESNL